MGTLGSRSAPSRPFFESAACQRSSSCFRFRLRAEAQRKLGSREEEEGAGPWRPRRRTVVAAMALPGSLNRYLLLMAQEHLEFRLPVSCPEVPGAEARTPHAPAWGVSAGSCARLD